MRPMFVRNPILGDSKCASILSSKKLVRSATEIFPYTQKIKQENNGCVSRVLLKKKKKKSKTTLRMLSSEVKSKTHICKRLKTFLFFLRVHKKPFCSNTISFHGIVNLITHAVRWPPESGWCKQQRILQPTLGPQPLQVEQLHIYLLILTKTSSISPINS